MLAQVAFAQAGRIKRVPPTPSPSPVSSASSSTPTSSAASSASAPTTRPTFHPAAFIITGKTEVKDMKSYGDDDSNDVARGIKFMFEFQRLPAKIVKGGKMTREKAVARAKQETDSYVVWMDLQEKMLIVNLRPVYIVDHIDYVLLMPGTGEVVRQFTLNPSTIVQRNGQGTPLPPRTQGRNGNLTEQLEHCAWEIARVLEYWL